MGTTTTYDPSDPASIDSLPEHVRPIALKYPIMRDGEHVCYRSSQKADWHFVIRSYDYDPTNHKIPATLTLVHGRDSSLPGAMLGQSEPDHLISCGCGKWRMPTEDQIAKLRGRIARGRR